MTAGLHAVHTQNFNTGIGESMMNSYSVFASFFTLFIAGGTVFSILSGIITIRRSYKIKVEVAVDKTTDSLSTQ
ncbi:hypothetical protein FACS1894218_4290 [Bacilli bacterium]|nr:hypothetical protein FACS1894218_4290 [Bacilli bacterium]